MLSDQQWRRNPHEAQLGLAIRGAGRVQPKTLNMRTSKFALELVDSYA